MTAWVVMDLAEVQHWATKDKDCMDNEMKVTIKSRKLFLCCELLSHLHMGILREGILELEKDEGIELEKLEKEEE